MIYPATYDITILQNATWKAALRATEQRQELEGITISGGSPLFSAYCHKLEDGDKVVFTTASVESSGFISLAPSPETKVPCGLELNSIYYVIASGLTNDNFYVAESSGGTAIQAEDDAILAFLIMQKLLHLPAQLLMRKMEPLKLRWPLQYLLVLSLVVTIMM
jgi:hypothetical protein